MAINVNRVVLTGNLTHDPELHQAENTTSRCRLRLAVNGRRRDKDGNWSEKPNYVNVTVWGVPAENCAKYLARGRAIAVDGRLDWHSWLDEADKPRQALQVIAETVQFLGSPPSPPRQPDSEPSVADDAPPVVAPDIPEPAPLAGVAAAVATDRDEIPF
jgi:single-strand DNA-binding protein